MSGEIVTPADCALLVGVPLTRSEFERQFEDPRHDFSRHVARELGGGSGAEDAWYAYRSSVEIVESAVRLLERWGGHVVPRATVADWPAALASHKAVALLAHAPADAQLELASGIIETNELVERSSREFAGVIDLMSCYSLTLAMAIKAHARMGREPAKCMVIANNARTLISARAFRFICVLQLLRSRPLGYAEATHLIGRELFELRGQP